MFPSFLPGTDNLSKYLLTIGFVLIFFAIVYPMQKEEKLKLDELSLLMEIDLLNQDIKGICNKINDIKKDSIETGNAISLLKSKLVKAKFKDSLIIEDLILNKKNEFKKQVTDAEIITDSLQKKSTNLRYEAKKQAEIKSQIKSYSWFKWIFLFFGTLFIFLGFRFWLSATYVDEMQKCNSLNFPTSSNNSSGTSSPSNPLYESSFIRIRKWIKSNTQFIRRIINI